MNFKKSHVVLILVAALFLGFVGAYFGVSYAQKESEEAHNDPSASISGESSKPATDIDKVGQAYDLIKKNYVQDVDEKQLIEGAIQGMLASLEDPYSAYMDVEMMEQFNEQIESSFEGIGAEVSMVNGKVTIVAPIKDSPAEKAGLRPNDQVLSVDGESLEGLDLNEAVSKIRGEKGSEVVLQVQRTGASKPFDVPIIRDTIPLETIYADMKTIDNKKTGIIEITNFSERTADEFRTALEKLEKDGMEGLILDVRGNPGGLLNSVEDILRNFIPKDTPYVQIEDKNGKKEKYYTELNQKKDYPIRVMINEGSASASEILAVAMKEIGYDVVGATSFGKGTVQQAVPLGDGSTIKLTFYKWLSPKGNWIHEKGVEPTIEVKQPDYYYANPVQLEKTLTYNHTGEAIENIQRMLTGLGYDTARTDGYFSQKTVEAVKAFQKDNDLKVTGDVDSKTAGMVEAKVVESIRNGENDMQLEKALDSLYK
ncbi:S41 family peptidase [Virgibacillus sp. MG-45]|uniref:S41 family peptidase n=1 Tax=Virgibacillus sp. MG-45 TaxID=3102791 RepID=UPI002EDA392A